MVYFPVHVPKNRYPLADLEATPKTPLDLARQILLISNGLHVVFWGLIRKTGAVKIQIRFSSVLNFLKIAKAVSRLDLPSQQKSF